MNAHINNDLPWALLQTWDELGLEPPEDSPAYRDFQLVNTILAPSAGEVRATLESGVAALARPPPSGATTTSSPASPSSPCADEAWRRGARWRAGFDAEEAAAHERQVGHESHLILAL